MSEENFWIFEKHHVLIVHLTIRSARPRLLHRSQFQLTVNSKKDWKRRLYDCVNLSTTVSRTCHTSKTLTWHFTERHCSRSFPNGLFLQAATWIRAADGKKNCCL